MAYVLSLLLLPRLIPQKAMGQIWNPFSLLHIPLYGVLMLLLVSAFWPWLLDPRRALLRPSTYLFPGGIATLVGILDEINQIFIPYRDASIMDLFLDMCGIILAALFIISWKKRKKR